MDQTYTEPLVAKRKAIEILLAQPAHRMAVGDLESELARTGVAMRYHNVWDLLAWLRNDGRVDYDRDRSGLGVPAGSAWLQSEDGSPVPAP